MCCMLHRLGVNSPAALGLVGWCGEPPLCHKHSSGVRPNLVEIKYCEDARPQNHLNAAKKQQNYLCNILQGAPVTLQSSFWVWAAPSTTLTLWSLSRNWVSILKKLRRLPPSSMCTLWTLLLNLSIPDVPFPVLLSTLIRSRFQAKPATLLIPIDFSFPFRGGGALRFSVPKWLLFLN